MSYLIMGFIYLSLNLCCYYSYRDMFLEPKSSMAATTDFALKVYMLLSSLFIVIVRCPMPLTSLMIILVNLMI
jgi:hypothetical protein